ELGDVRERAVGLAQQLMHAAGGDLKVEASLLDRGAHDEASVCAGNKIDALSGDDASGDHLLRGPAKDEELPLDRPDRGAGARRQPGPGSRPGPSREYDAVSAVLPALRGHDPGEPVILED